MTFDLNNSLTLHNGYVLNGVAHFTQSSNPTTRIGGSPLVVGDKLYRTDLREDCFWNGTLFLSTKDLICLFGVNAGLATIFGAANLNNSSGFAHIRQNLFCTKIGVSGLVLAISHDGSNFITFEWRPTANVTPSFTFSMTTNPWTLGTYKTVEVDVNTVLGDLNGWTTAATATGTIGATRLQTYAICKQIIT